MRPRPSEWHVSEFEALEEGLDTLARLATTIRDGERSLAAREAFAALGQELERLRARVDGNGPQISMGTAAGILQREVDARKLIEGRVAELEQVLFTLRPRASSDPRRRWEVELIDDALREEEQ